MAFGRYFIVILLLSALSLGDASKNSKKSTSDQDDLVIQSVTLNTDPSATTLSGSLAGGTELLIKGEGFDHSNPLNNQVKVGLKTCEVSSATRKELKCLTGYYGSSDSAGLEISVSVGSSSRTATRTFQYVNSLTPVANAIYPSTISASGSVFNILGIHRISQVGNGNGGGYPSIQMTIGDEQCGRNGLNTLNINANVPSFIDCKMTKKMEVGKYKYTERISAGEALTGDLIRSEFDEDEEDYHICVLPAISHISPPGGTHQAINIHGEGFPQDATRVSVVVAGRVCNVISSASNKVRCSITSTRVPSGVVLVKGSGWDYAKYTSFSTSLDLRDRATLLSHLSSRTPALTGVKLELKSKESVSTTKLETYKGYFKAPTTGPHVLRGLADTKFALFINPTPSVASIPAGTAASIYSNLNTGTSEFFSFDAATKLLSDPVEMVEGQMYYMELYYMSSSSPGFMEVSVQYPSSDPTSQEFVYSAQKITLQADVKPEILQFWQTGATSGTINLGITVENPETFQTSVICNYTIPYNCSITEFINKLKTCPAYQYSMTGERIVQDINGDAVLPSDEENNGYKYIWKITILDIRTQDHLAAYFDIYELTDTNGDFFELIIQDHTPFLGGSFQLVITVNGMSFGSLQVQHNSTAGFIQESLRDMPYLSEANVMRTGDTKSSVSWVIFFNGLPYDPVLTIIPQITGGDPNNPPNATVSVLGNYAQVKTFKYLDHNFLYQAGGESAVVVTVDDGVYTSVCEGTCIYGFEVEAPTVTNIELVNGQQLNITIAGPLGAALDTSSYIIGNFSVVERDSGKPCVLSAGATLPHFTCTLPLNDDETLDLEAGELKVNVIMTPLGALAEYGSIAPIIIPLNANTIQSTSGLTLGGYNLTVRGSGFARVKENIKIKLCDAEATVLESFTNKAVIEAPGCADIGMKDVSIEFKTFVNMTLQFEYLAPSVGDGEAVVIDSITPNSVSPVIKRALKIAGSGFGTDKTRLSVYMANADRSQQKLLKVLLIEDSLLTVGFPGCLADVYFIRIVKEGESASRVSSPNANMLTAKIIIDSISPATGSPYGGTRLTITGRNFSPEQLQNLVNVGMKPNTFCELISFTSSQIQCVMPAIPAKYKNNTQEIFVTSKLTEDAYCEDSVNHCHFTYTSVDDYQGIMIVDLQNDTYALETDYLVITISQQWNTDDNQLVFINALTQEEYVVEWNSTNVIGTSVNGSEIKTTVLFPKDLGASFYQITFRSAAGFGNKMFLERRMGAITEAFYCVLAGGIIELDGFALPSSLTILENYYKLEWNTTQLPMTFLASDPHKITVRVMPTTQAYGRYRFKLVGPTNSMNFYIQVRPQSSSVSLPLSYTTAATSGNKRNANVVLSTGNFPFTAIKVRNSVSKNLVKELIPSEWTYNSVAKRALFSIQLRPGTYEVMANLKVAGFNGWYVASSKIVIVTSNTVSYNMSAISLSGGLFSVQGLFSDAAIIRVNGQEGTFSHEESGISYFNIPQQTAIYLPTEISTLFPSEQPTSGPPASGDSDSSACPYQTNNNGEGQDIIKQLQNAGYIFNYIADVNSNLAVYAFDDLTKTTYTSTNFICYVGLQLTGTIGIFLKSISLKLPSTTSDFIGAVLEGKTLQGSWESIYTIPSDNNLKNLNLKRNVDLDQNISCTYKGLRIRHNSLSQCKVDKLSFGGDLVQVEPTVPVVVDVEDPNSEEGSSQPINTVGFDESQPFDAVIIDGSTTVNMPDAIVFSLSATPVVKNVQPKVGDYLGGYNLTIQGENLGPGVAAVYIDGVPCIVLESSSTQIICEVQERFDDNTQMSFQVTVSGQDAILEDQFLYGLRWSVQSTWGYDFKPNSGDLIYVPKGQTLWVDESTPPLLGIVVEGRIIFSDEADMTITTDFITVNGGIFQAGTEDKPYNHKLQFLMTGTSRIPAQPFYGTKVIACEACQLNIHGKGEIQRWDMISATINAGDTQLSLLEPIPADKAHLYIGKKIVIATTDLSSDKTEVKVISSIVDGKIVVSTPFAYKHICAQLDDGTFLRAEVGFLDSNIIIRGVDNYIGENFGAKLMIRGEPSVDGSYAKISNIEVTHCGQSYTGDYCIIFFYTGLCDTSYIRSSSIHETFTRPLYLPYEIHRFQIKGNFLYHGAGNNIVVESMFSANNLIAKNLILNSLRTYSLYQSDIYPTGIMLRGFLNPLIDNHIGGCTKGIVYDNDVMENNVCSWTFKQHPDVQNNYIHSVLSALYVKKIYANDPGSCYLNSYYVGTTEIKGFIIYLSQDAVDIEQIYQVTFKDLILVDNYRYFDQLQIIMYRTSQYPNLDSSLLTNISFYQAIPGQARLSQNFGSFISLYFNLYLPVRNCYFSAVAGSSISIFGDSYSHRNFLTVVTSNITYAGGSYSGQYFAYGGGNGYTIIHDEDGTLTQSQERATVIRKFPYIQVEQNCTSHYQVLVCNNYVDITFASINSYLYNRALVISYLSNITDITEASTPQFTFPYQDSYYEIPLVSNRYYQFSFVGAHFTYVYLTKPWHYPIHPGSVVLRYPYTIDNLQQFLVQAYNPYYSSQQISNGTYLQPDACIYSNYDHVVDQKYLGLCVSDAPRIRYIYVRIILVPVIPPPPPPTPPTPVDPVGCDTDIISNFSVVWSDTSIWPNNRLPAAGQTVVIKPHWQMTMDIQPAPIKFLIVQGELTIEDTADITIEAQIIWVKGSIQAGTPQAPFQHKLVFKLTGTSTSDEMDVPNGERGNKLFVVTGSLDLYGKRPDTLWTPLAATVLPGATTISVEDTTGWAAGDSITLSSSFTNPEQTEYGVISSVSSNQITLTAPLKHTHFGGASTVITAVESLESTVDTRTVVSLLSRNIKIITGESQSWGFSIYVTKYTNCTTPRYGSLNLFGVELANGGQQYHSRRAAVDIRQNMDSDTNSTISYSTFRGCQYNCLSLKNVQNIDILDNVFAGGKVFLISMNGANILNTKIQGNLLMDVRAGQVNKVACLEWKETIYSDDVDGTVVKDNICIGSTGAGFSYKYMQCGKQSLSVFSNNLVGSATIGYLLQDQVPSTDTECLTAENLVAYSCKVGVLGNPTKPKVLIYNKIVSIDSKVGISLKFINNGTNLTAELRDSHIAIMERVANCPQCGDMALEGSIAYECSGMTGVQMLVVTEEQTWRYADSVMFYNETLLDLISQAASDSKAFITNVVFKNFRTTGVDIADDNLNAYLTSKCTQNSVFGIPKTALELIGSHHLYNSQCVNCEPDAAVKFPTLSYDDVGEYGACGNIPCTGNQNFFVQDHSGTFYNLGSFVPSTNMTRYMNSSYNTEGASFNESCEYFESMNGFFCHTSLIYALEYESLTADKNSRVTWPVDITPTQHSEEMTNIGWDTEANQPTTNDSVTYDGETLIENYTYDSSRKWTTEVNGFKEWSFRRGIPRGTRLGRFVMLLHANDTYNLTFHTPTPKDMVFQMQQKLPGGTAPEHIDWSILRVFYPVSTSVRVTVMGAVIDPITILNNNAEMPLLAETANCGANKYYYRDRSIDFVITNQAQCRPRLTLTNSIQLTAKFEMDIDNFFAMDGKTKFIDRMAAVLGISDRSRIKVVGMFRGSVLVEAYIEPSFDSTGSETDVVNETAQIAQLDALSQILNNATQSGEIETVFAAAGFGEVLLFQSLVRDSSYSEPKDESGITVNKKAIAIVGVIVGSAVGVAAIIFLAVYCWKKRKQSIAESDTLSLEEKVEKVQVSELSKQKIVFSDQNSEKGREDSTPQQKRRPKINYRGLFKLKKANRNAGGAQDLTQSIDQLNLF